MSEKWAVVDAHSHYLPAEAVAKTGIVDKFDYSALLKGDQRFQYGKMQDIEALLCVMEDAGVDMAVLNQSAWSPQGMEVCKAMNDGYARVGRDYPGKFILCGHVPPREGQDVVDEIERCVNYLGLKGISIPSSMSDTTTLDAPELRHMYQKINELDVPIVIHPTVRFPLWGGGAKYDMHKTLTREYDIAKGVVEVMYGVLKDFPTLKFLMPHYGGGMSGLKARLRARFAPEGWNIPPDLRHKMRTPKELEDLGLDKAFDELFDKLYFDMAGSGCGWLPMIKSALLTISPARTCFGTDYPYDINSAEGFRSFIDTIKQLDIPEREKRLMLGENTKRLFKVE